MTSTINSRPKVYLLYVDDETEIYRCSNGFGAILHKSEKTYMESLWEITLLEWPDIYNYVNEAIRPWDDPAPILVYDQQNQRVCCLRGLSHAQCMAYLCRVDKIKPSTPDLEWFWNFEI